ncbi:hypothetical protein AV530_017396 [Patagioenas fasciata monilis]|uniref:Uncharacterized protein n=1 Tax=Patagioenas fasciata monilis TaxID=372326 RepID=A0A1V4JFY5_PATFA|nr:hypothetical protein AV530_017396 [Patagioenas fasciata monilis]
MRLAVPGCRRARRLATATRRSAPRALWRQPGDLRVRECMLQPEKACRTRARPIATPTFIPTLRSMKRNTSIVLHGISRTVLIRDKRGPQVAESNSYRLYNCFPITPHQRQPLENVGR